MGENNLDKKTVWKLHVVLVVLLLSQLAIDNVAEFTNTEGNIEWYITEW
jgi:hypothetical protein